MTNNVRGWKLTRGKGIVTLTKGDYAVETTFNPKDDGAADLAEDHALAQAYALDTPDHDLDGRSVDEQWRIIHAWTRKGD